MSSSISMIRPQGFPRTKRRRKANGEYDDEKFRGRSMSQPTAPSEQRRLCGRLHHRVRQADRPRGHAHRAFFLFFEMQVPPSRFVFCKRMLPMAPRGQPYNLWTFICIFFNLQKKETQISHPNAPFTEAVPR